MSKSKYWVGFDLDGTLAKYHGWVSPQDIGEPIKEIVDILKKVLEKGLDAKIITARVSRKKDDWKECEEEIKKWCVKNLGMELDVVCEKDHQMIYFYDDRVIQVEKNTGRVLMDFYSDKINLLIEENKKLRESIVNLGKSCESLMKEVVRKGVTDWGLVNGSLVESSKLLNKILDVGDFKISCDYIKSI